MKRFFVFAFLFLVAVTAAAQTWPAKPVKFVVPSPAGGGPDRVTRLVAAKLSQRWGHPVIVENRAGATTMVGTEYVAKQPADGYTFLATFTSFVQMPALFQKIPYDPVRDF